MGAAIGIDANPLFIVTIVLLPLQVIHKGKQSEEGVANKDGQHAAPRPPSVAPEFKCKPDLRATRLRQRGGANEKMRTWQNTTTRVAYDGKDEGSSFATDSFSLGEHQALKGQDCISHIQSTQVLEDLGRGKADGSGSRHCSQCAKRSHYE